MARTGKQDLRAQFSDALEPIDELQRRFAQPEHVWPRVGEYLSGIAAEQFDTQGGRLGEPWPPLSPKYAAYKARRGGDRRVLVDTGAMRAEFVWRPMTDERYLPDGSAQFWVRDPKAEWHQTGAGRLPVRRILFVTPEIDDRVTRMLADYLSDNL